MQVRQPGGETTGEGAGAASHVQQVVDVGEYVELTEGAGGRQSQAVHAVDEFRDLFVGVLLDVDGVRIDRIRAGERRRQILGHLPVPGDHRPEERAGGKVVGSAAGRERIPARRVDLQKAECRGHHQRRFRRPRRDVERRRHSGDVQRPVGESLVEAKLLAEGDHRAGETAEVEVVEGAIIDRRTGEGRGHVESGGIFG